MHPEELQDSTKKKLNDRGYFYANSNAGLGWTDRANRYGSSALVDSRLYSMCLTERRSTNGVLFLAHLSIPIREISRVCASCTQKGHCRSPIPLATIFGHRIPAPICFAPIGINKLYSPKGELVPATVAGELGLPYCLSTAGSQPIEDVAAANDQSAEVRNESNSVHHYDGRLVLIVISHCA